MYELFLKTMYIVNSCGPIKVQSVTCWTTFLLTPHHTHTHTKTHTEDEEYEFEFIDSMVGVGKYFDYKPL